MFQGRPSAGLCSQAGGIVTLQPSVYKICLGKQLCCLFRGAQLTLRDRFSAWRRRIFRYRPTVSLPGKTDADEGSTSFEGISGNRFHISADGHTDQRGTVFESGRSDLGDAVRDADRLDPRYPRECRVIDTFDETPIVDIRNKDILIGTSSDARQNIVLSVSAQFKLQILAGAHAAVDALVIYDLMPERLYDLLLFQDLVADGTLFAVREARLRAGRRLPWNSLGRMA